MQTDVIAAGIMGNLISLNTLLTLRAKGVLTHIETLEIVEQTLLNLETHEELAEPPARQVWQSAREHLELLRKEISDLTPPTRQK